MSQRSHGWCFTLNNYSEPERIHLLETKAKYVIIGEEIGEAGTPHLQGFIQFDSPGKTLAACRKIEPKAHWEITKGNIDQNVEYCSKEGHFEERGTKPMNQKRKGEAGKASIEERWELAKQGRFEELPPEQIKTYEYICSKFKSVEDRGELTNLWIHGPSGCGKSRYVRDNYPEFYSKGMSKWWDGYQNEDVVLLDDFDPKHGEFLSYYLKIWADHYAFNAEVKGGMLKIRPKVVIVTSQYRLDDCFKELETFEALDRRFKKIRLPEDSSDVTLVNNK